MNKELYKEVASLIAHANESLPVETPIEFAVVEEVANRAVSEGDDAIGRVAGYLSAIIGENFSCNQDLDLLPDNYITKLDTVEQKINWLEENSRLEPAQVALIASAVDPELVGVESIHAWKRLEILKNTGQISEEAYNLTLELEREAAPDYDL